MKNIVRYSAMLLIVFMIGSSCTEDFLEVENRNNLALSSFFKTQKDALYAVNTCYYGLAGRGMHGHQWYMLFNSFDDRILFETPNFDQITINSSSGNISAMFQDLSVGLFRTSSVLQNLIEREIPDLDEETKEQYMAQCYALQAAYYFHLVTLFDQPYFYDETSVPEDPEEIFGNGEREQFWDKIESNLDYAKDILPEAYPPSDIGRVTKYMANALLGKAMLWKYYHYYARFGNQKSAEATAALQKAKAAFQEVMNGPFELVKPMEPKTRLDYIYAHLSNFSYQDLPSENNLYVGEYTTESIWMIMYSTEFYNNVYLPAWMSAGHRNSEYFSPHESSYKNHGIHPYLWLEFEETGAPAGFDRDPRAYSTCYIDGDLLDFRAESDYYNDYFESGKNYKTISNSRGISIPGQPTIGFGLKKYYFPVYYEAPNAPKNDPTNRNYIRYADVLLMYAETMYLLGDDGTGLEALNTVRRRVDMPDATELTAETIIHERDVELATEGHRFLDLIRWSFDEQWGINWDEIEWGINATNSVNPFVVGKHEYLPIPLREINLSQGELEQNPGW